MGKKIFFGFWLVFISWALLPGKSVYAESPKAHLADLVAQLQSSPDDQELRKKIIKLSLKMSTKPETPDEVGQFLGQAKYIMKQAKAPEDYKDAVEALKKASLLADLPPFFVPLPISHHKPNLLNPLAA